jgi:hypothetical protein
MHPTLLPKFIGKNLSYFIRNSGLDYDAIALSVKKELTRKGKVIASPDFSTWAPTQENIIKLNNLTKCSIPYLFRLLHNPLSILDTVAAYVANTSLNNIKLLENFLSLVAYLNSKGKDNIEINCYLAIFLGYLDYANTLKRTLNSSSKVGALFKKVLSDSFLKAEIDSTKLHTLIGYLALGNGYKNCLNALMYYYQVFSGIYSSTPDFTSICSSSDQTIYGVINATSSKLQFDYTSPHGFLSIVLAPKIDEAILTEKLVSTLFSYAHLMQVNVRRTQALPNLYLYLVNYGYLARFDISELMGNLALIHVEGWVNNCFQVSNGVKNPI